MISFGTTPMPSPIYSAMPNLGLASTLRVHLAITKYFVKDLAATYLVLLSFLAFELNQANQG